LRSDCVLEILLTTSYGHLKFKQREVGGSILDKFEIIEIPGFFLSGDINGDGFPDLITKTNYSEIRFYRNDVGNFYRSSERIALEDISYRLAMGDWNNDSYLDLPSHNQIIKALDL